MRAEPQPPTLRQQQERYRQRYREKRLGGILPPWERQPLPEALPHFQQALAALAPGATFLDAGCGSRGLAVEFAKAGIRSLALDFAEEAVWLTRQQALKEAPGRVAILWASVCDLPLRDNCVDGITCLFVNSHLAQPDRERAHRELLRVLRPGGWLLVSEWSVESRDVFGFTPTPDNNEHLRPDGSHLDHFFTSQELQELYTPWYEILSLQLRPSQYELQQGLRFVDILMRKRGT